MIGLEFGPMIQVIVREEAEKRGMTKPYHLAVNLGISSTLASRLWEGKPLPRLESLNTICESWQVDLCALVRWVPERPKRTTKRRAKSRVASSKRRQAG